MLPSFLALVYLTLLVGLAYGIGRLLTRRLTDDLSYLERFVFAVPVGLGAIGLFVWLCGLLGFVSPVLYGGLLGLGIPGLLVLAKDRLKTRPRRIKLRDRAGHFRLPLLIVVAASLVMILLRLFTMVGALAPPSGLEWDALSYHLANQKTWLAHGRIDYLPWDHHSNFPFIAQMLYLLMLGVGSIGGAKLVHWFCFVLLGFSLYTFGERHIRPRTRGRVIGSIAGLIVATTPIVLWEATVAYVDLATALFTWLSLYGLINATQAVEKRKPSVPWLVLSAILMGFALGTKYTVLGFWGLCLVGILGWNLVLTKKWAKETLPHTILWGAISLALGLPWYIKNWIVAGNPVYPFAYNLLGGKYWSTENAKQYAEEQARFGMGKSPLELLLSPWKVTYELNYLPQHLQETGRPFIYTEYIIYGFGLSPVLIALLMALPLIGKRLSRASVYCLLFGLGVFAFWFFVMQQTRYLIPALPGLAIVAAETFILLWEETKSLARYVAAGLIGISALWAVVLAGGLAFWGVPGVFGGHVAPAWPVVSGQILQQDYVRQTLPGVGAACFWINENTGKNEKVAIFDETRAFYLDREYLWAQPDHAEGLLPWNDYKDVDDFLADFKKRGLTVWLMGKRPDGAPDDGKKWRALVNEAILSDKVTLAFEEKGVRVYRIP